MKKEKAVNNHKMEKTGGYQPTEKKGLQPHGITNIGKPPSGGSKVKSPVDKK